MVKRVFIVQDHRKRECHKCGRQLGPGDRVIRYGWRANSEGKYPAGKYSCQDCYVDARGQPLLKPGQPRGGDRIEGLVLT